MHKRLFSVVGVIAMIAGLLAFAASPAQAQRPFSVQQFEPNDTPFATGGNCAVAPGCVNDYLSDKVDGVDALAHLTAVATPETDSVTWYACPLGTAVTTQNALTSCSVVIGTDTSGTIPPIGPGASSPADEAYDVFWDIPGSLDQQRRDIAALACIGPGQDIEGADANCRVDEEDSIFLEDAQTGAAQNQTTSGEFGSYRTLQGCFNVAPGNTACDAAYKPFVHGSPVPNDGFDFQAFTSDDINNLQAAVNEPADAQQEPNNATFDGFVNCTLEQTFTNFKRWRCAIGDALIANDAELAINLLNANGAGAQPEGTGGYCNSSNNTNAPPRQDPPNPPPSGQNVVAGAHDACVMDVHYIVSSSRQASRMVQTFAPNPPSPSANASCATPDTDEASNLGTTEDATLCLFDQFTDPFQGPWTEETTGAGSIADCGPEGTGHDHDGDGVFEDCVGNTGADGVSSGITFQNPTGPTGDQTLTGCHDPHNQTTVPPVANHGCTDTGATLKATKVIHWGTQASEVFLAFTDPAPSDASDPCRTGETFKDNVVGDFDDIVACTFDSSGNPVPTDPGAQRIQWTITGAQGEEPTAVRFNPAPPPSETTGTAAQSTARIEAVEQGDNFVNVFLLNANGDVIDAFSVEKQVVRRGGGGNGGPTPRACRNPGGGRNVIVGTNGDDVLTGTSGRDVICGAGGDDVISGRGGADLITGNGGNDTIGAGGGKDNVSGNAGNDNIGGNKGNDSLKGNRGNDALKGHKGVDTLSGGGGNDTLQGGNGNDVLKGGSGNDTLRGGKQDDALDGGPGRDQCIGGPGNDSLRRCP